MTGFRDVMPTHFGRGGSGATSSRILAESGLWE